MKRLAISALALALAIVPGVVSAKADSGMNRARPGAVASAGRHNWGPKHNGRWIGGWRAPGGWGAYRAPVRGYALPRYWINPSYYIGNYSRYGLYRPAAGYGWSRYYDDVVLTNATGQIYDSIPNFGWDRYDGYSADGYNDDGGYDDGYYASEDYGDSWGYRDDRPPVRSRDRDGGLGGALAGGAAGAIGGAIIGGRGARAEGAVIGGVVGAVAGAAIDKADRYGRGPKIKKLSRKQRDRLRYDDYGYDDRRAGATYDRRYEDGPREARGPYYEGDYGPSRYHWDRGYRRPPVGGRGRGPQVIYRGGHGGYWGQGWDSGVTTIVVQSQPVVTTTTYTTEEVVYASASRKRYAAKKKVWRPRPKPRCACR